MARQKIPWTPPNILGNYDIIASFAGSNSYYSSSSEAHTVVVSTTPTTAPLVSTNGSVSSSDMYYIIGVGIAMIIAIAIVGLVLYRKKP